MFNELEIGNAFTMLSVRVENTHPRKANRVAGVEWQAQKQKVSGGDDTGFPSKNAKRPNWRCLATRRRVFSTAIHNLLTRLSKTELATG